LFLKLKNEEVLKECERIEEFFEKKSENNNQIAASFEKRVILVNPKKLQDCLKKLSLKKIFGNNLPIKIEVCSDMETG
jgi:hypothetical protein